MLVTIDLWGTLIKASPTFSKAKEEYIKQFFEIEETTESIDQVFKKTKEQLNCIIEATGWQPTEREIYTLLYSNLSDVVKVGNHKRLQEIQILFVNPSNPNHLHASFVHGYYDLARRNPPVLYSEQTKEYLENLSKKARLVLSSNTLFLPAQVLHDAIVKLDILKYFYYLKFSSIHECSKPNPKMFLCSVLKGGLYLSTFPDFHIGDNLKTDYLGSQRYGIKGILINSNDKTIKDAYDQIINSK